MSDAKGDNGEPELVLGPLLRHVDRTSATIWVETDRPCTVTVLGTRCPTFTVHGHHYALIEVAGLTPGTSTPYTVRLDDKPAWPDPSSPLPPSRITIPDPDTPVRVFFGSCRVSVPSDAEHTAAYGVDALRAYARSLLASPEEFTPTVLLLIGDQVYADEPSEAMRGFIRGRRDVTRPPGEEVLDYAEYAELYRLAWSDPLVRWLLANVPTAMTFDDHDLRDDWNTSQAWQDEMARTSWWRERLVAGLGAYGVYQHLGNLGPAELARDPLARVLRGGVRGTGKGGEGPAAGEASATVCGSGLDTALDRFVEHAGTSPEGTRWSFRRDIGRTRVIVLDSRCARVLTPGARAMLGPSEWEWLREAVKGDYDHLVIASSVPVLLPLGLQYGERWNEALCDGAWGPRAARFGERLRQVFDLEHWGAFRRTFDDLSRLLIEIAGGGGPEGGTGAEGDPGAASGRPPASITLISGDVHYSYLAKVRYRPTEPGPKGPKGRERWEGRRGGKGRKRRGGKSSAPQSYVVESHDRASSQLRGAEINQVVCSPIRNPLGRLFRIANVLAATRPVSWAGRLLAGLAGVPPLGFTWRVEQGPWFDNALAALTFTGRRCDVHWYRPEQAHGPEGPEPRLTVLGRRRLS